MKAWRARHPDVAAADLPGDVPELNPGEGVWGGTTSGRWANPAANDLQELWGHGVDARIAGKHGPDLPRALIRQTDVPGLSLAA